MNETISINKKELKDDVEIIDYQPFSEVENSFNIDSNVELYLECLDSQKPFYDIISMSGDIIVKDHEALGNGYDICINLREGKRYVSIITMLGRTKDIFEIKEDASKLKLDIKISHRNSISKININGIEKEIKVHGKSYNSIVIGGKENIYGEIIHKFLPLKINNFVLNYNN